jgi:hypothetical protein
VLRGAAAADDRVPAPRELERQRPAQPSADPRDEHRPGSRRRRPRGCRRSPARLGRRHPLARRAARMLRALLVDWWTRGSRPGQVSMLLVKSTHGPRPVTREVWRPTTAPAHAAVVLFVLGAASFRDCLENLPDPLRRLRPRLALAGGGKEASPSVYNSLLG